MVLVMFSEYISIQWVLYLVLSLLGLSLSGVMLIFGLCIYRKVRDRKKNKVINQFREKFIDIVCQESSEIPPMAVPKDSRGVVRNLLLSTIGSLQGEGKRRLMTIYHKQLFLAYDFVSLKTGTFRQKLTALARLETVRESVNPTVVIRLLGDESPYIHFAALRFLLRKNKGYYPVIDIEMKRLEELKRFDMALEILSCYSICCPDRFIEFLSAVQSQRIRMAALDVVYKRRIMNALPVVRDVLAKVLALPKVNRIDIQEVKKAIFCLSISPMPENEDLLVSLTTSPVSEIRVLAFRAWIQMRPDSLQEILERMENDGTEVVYRIAQQLRQRPEAPARVA